ncbi:isoleucine--tRNA ligase [Candidatus Dependentiae bacterium]
MSDKKNSKKNPYQDTLNLPKTEFGIRANAAIKEPEILKEWKNKDLYNKSWNHNKDQKKYVLHDGPPYANGHIHLGSALNKVYKDFVTKFWRMTGCHVPVKPGWDCHGLPIELKALAEIEKVESKIDLIKCCRKFADKWVDVQREEFKNLGVVMDWDNPYIVMHPEYESSILNAFAKFIEKGFIERKGKTVPWCASCKTVLAAAEIEYQDRKDPSIYVLFPFTQEISKELFEDILKNKSDLEINLLVWTTTPWTLALNRAVMLNNNAKYVLLELPQKNRSIIVAKDLVDKICSVLEIDKKILAEFDSKIFEGKRVNHPFISNLQVPVLLENSVMLNEGTACVHTAPGCGPEDYFVGLKNNIEIFSPISADGKYTKGIEPKELEGMLVKDGQFWALKKLSEVDRLLHKKSIKHSYPHCWRCHNGLIFRATDQWFCNLKKDDLIKKSLKEIQNIKFVPEWGKTRLSSFISNRTEWCISRQRTWGVPIPAVICKKCDHAILKADFTQKIAEGVKKEGIEYWVKFSMQDMQDNGILPKDFKCEKCGNTDLNEFKKETDILDVWFDSGVSHYAVLNKDQKNLGIPADMYFEGSDQHRGWFQSSLLSSMIINKKTPTKQINTHGFVVDAKGYKMSKSVGNVVAPDEVIQKYSRDVLRLWVASSDYYSDIAISDKILKNVFESYRKIRNTCRFMISNLYDFDVQKDVVAVDKLLKIDQYALAELFYTNDKIITAYKESNFASVYNTLNNYCINNLSSLYLDMCKDRLYVEQSDGHLRRSAQTSIYLILDTITHLMAPILSFLAEEVSDYYQKNKKDSIHLQNFVNVENIWELLSFKNAPEHIKIPKINLTDLNALKGSFIQKSFWNFLEQLRDIVLKEIEGKRKQEIIKHSLEAKIKIYLQADSEQKQLLDNFIKELKESGENVKRFFKDWFIVSDVEICDKNDNLNKTSADWVCVDVLHSPGVKCPRCWQWEETDHETGLCSRCRSVLKK